MTSSARDDVAEASAQVVGLADSAQDLRLDSDPLPGGPALSWRGQNQEIGGAFATSRVPLAPGSIALTGGFPGADVLPIPALAQAFGEVLSRPDAGINVVQYHGPFGTDELRSWIAEDQQTDVERVLVTNGALHAMSFAVEALVEPGDVAIVEDPAYPFAVRLLRYFGADVRSVPVDGEGIAVDALELLLRSGVRPKLLYTVPDFHNPSAVTLSAERRDRILSLAEHYGFVVISDNPYRALRFTGTEIPDFDVDSERVVRAGTFSKILGPGLRVGWAVAPRWLRDAFVRTRLATDQHAGLVTQRVVEHLVTQPGFYADTVRFAQQNYAQRAHALHASLSAALGDRFVARIPDGGLFLWAQIRGADLHATLDRARATGVDFTHGDSFDPSGSGIYSDWARFAYSNATPQQLAVAAQRFAAALADVER